MTSLALALLVPPSAGSLPCPEGPSPQARRERERARTTRYPPGEFAPFLEILGRRLGALPGIHLPEGPRGSLLEATRPREERIRDLIRVLVHLESLGLHRDPEGRLLTSPARGRPLGFTQISRGAASEALAWWRLRGLPLDRGEALRGPDLREQWTWNLRLGAAYFLLRVRAEASRLPPSAPGESSPALLPRGTQLLLRSLVAYLVGPEARFLAGPPEEFRRGCGRRPEVRRYLRQALQLLEFPRPPAAWEEALEGRLTREAGGWETEARQLRERQARLFADCPP